MAYGKEDGPHDPVIRARRKAIDLEHTAAASPRAKTIKLADIIDNALDICRHDPRFARVYLAEIAALMEVLEEGDRTLYARAQETIDICSRRLGKEISIAGDQPIEFTVEEKVAFAQHRSIRFFIESFAAKDVLEPLVCFDLDASHEDMATAVREQGLFLIGLKKEGHVVGYLLPDDLDSPELSIRPILKERQVVADDSPLTDVVHALTQFAYTLC